MSEWISVKQRMPEEYAYCMLGGLAGVAEGFHFKAGAKECWKFTRTPGELIEARKITHWMPLPAPPEAE